MEKNRVNHLVMSAEEAVEQIFDGATLFVSGSGGGLLESNALLEALGKRFLAKGSPTNLTVIHALGIGDAKERGLECIAHEGLIGRVIGGHWSWSKKMQQLAFDEKIEAFCLPAGIITNLIRESGAGRPGLITEIGLNTFVDPAQTGGRVNQKATQSDFEPVSKIELNGREYLFYKSLHIDFSFLRGSFADCHGNISLANEAVNLESYAGALAGYNCKGKVFVQVKEVRSKPTLPARLAQIPGILVSGVIREEKQRQTYAGEYDPSISGESLAEIAKEEDTLDNPAKWIIARRAYRELKKGVAANFGFGIPDLITVLARQSGFTDFWTTVEQGVHGGVLQTGALFGCAKNPVSIVSSNDQFDFYDGGGNDIAFLGMGEADEIGNVNVSKLGKYIVGPGGFINISHNTPKVVFCGTFTAGGLKVRRENGRVAIVEEGKIRKMKKRVGEITYSGKQATLKNYTVVYVTERAVFELKNGKMHLTEIAEGIDLQKDVLGLMDFRPEMGEIKPMKVA